MSDIENTTEVCAISNEVETSLMDNLSWTPEEEKKLVRKIDLFLMPTWLMYLLSYMVGHRHSSHAMSVTLLLTETRIVPISATLR